MLPCYHSNHLRFNETAQTQMTHGNREQGLFYCGEVNWDMVYKGALRDLLEQEACEYSACLPSPKENVMSFPAEIMFSTGSEQTNKLRNYGPQKVLAGHNCARLCVICLCTCVCMSKNRCCTSRYIWQIHQTYKKISLIIHQFSSYPRLINAAIFISSCSVLFRCCSYMSNLQPYAANLILERGPCLKWLRAVSAKSDLSGIN